MSSAVTNLFKVINECFQSNLKIKTHFSNIDDHKNLDEKQVYSLDRVCTKNCIGPYGFNYQGRFLIVCAH